jgi:Na+-transporting NADH:ubiquinone oxidoreductase subunit NqrB
MELVFLLFLLAGTIIIIHILVDPAFRRLLRKKQSKENLSKKLKDLYKKAYNQGLKQRK